MSAKFKILYWKFLTIFGSMGGWGYTPFKYLDGDSIDELLAVMNNPHSTPRIPNSYASCSCSSVKKTVIWRYISGTKRGIIDPLVSKPQEKNSE